MKYNHLVINIEFDKVIIISKTMRNGNDIQQQAFVKYRNLSQLHEVSEIFIFQ